MDSVRKFFKKKYNYFKKSHRKVASFYSSLFAGLFVAVSFIFINYMAPLENDYWWYNWIIFIGLILVYLLVYYPVGISVIKSINVKELKGYKQNFFASLLAAIYLSLIILFKPGAMEISILTGILFITSLFVCFRLIKG